MPQAQWEDEESSATMELKKGKFMFQSKNIISSRTRVSICVFQARLDYTYHNVEVYIFEDKEYTESFENN